MAALTHLEEGHVAVAVDLVPWRVAQLALAEVALQLRLGLGEVEAELAKVQLVARGHLGWERGEVPRLHVELADLDPVDVLHLQGQLRLMVEGQALRDEV